MLITNWKNEKGRPFEAIVEAQLSLQNEKKETTYFGGLYLWSMIVRLILTQEGQTTERRGSGGKKVKNGSERWARGWGVSSTIAASWPEKSIHHFHVFVSRLTLPIARSVATMTQRIDEVQVGVASRGLGMEMVKPDVVRGGAGMDCEGDLMKVTMLPIAPINHIHLLTHMSVGHVPRRK